MTFSRIIVVTAALAALAAEPARADTMLTPFGGINFGGDSGRELGDAFDADRWAWGVSFSFMGAGVFGVEGDFSYSPDFFGSTDLGGSSVTTFMGNLLIGLPFGGQQGFGLRPYGLVGLGAVQPDGDAFDDEFSDLLEFGDTKVAWSAGGGLMMFFATHFGLRADLRYIRSFEAIDLIESAEPSELDFARFSLGLIFRF